MRHRFIKKIHPLSGDIFPWMQEFVEFVSISPRQRSLSRLKNKRWIFPGGSRDNVLSSTSSTDKWSSSAVTSLGRYYRAPILSPPNTERDRSPSTETSLLPRYPCLYYLTSYILVKLIKRVKCNNFDGIFQFLKFPPIFKYKYSRYSSLPSWILRTTNISNYPKIIPKFFERNDRNNLAQKPSFNFSTTWIRIEYDIVQTILSPLSSKGSKISFYLDQFKPLSRDIRSSLRNKERRRVENVETGKNGGRGKGPKGKVEGLLLRIFSR